MKSLDLRLVTAAWLGFLACRGAAQAQQDSPMVLEPRGKEFIFSSNYSHHVFVDVAEQKVAADKAGGGLKNFAIDLNAFPVGQQELPEIKLTVHGFQYVVAARKIVVSPPAPTTPGYFVQAALDPNGTGDYEVVLTVNWPDWPDHNKRPSLRKDLLPKTLDAHDIGAGWTNPKGGIAWTGRYLFRNSSGQPFILEQGYFDNLPTNEGWPVIEVPAAN